MSLTIRPRTLWVGHHSMLSPIGLEDVRRHLAQLANVQIPTDHRVPLRDVRVAFENNRMVVRLPGVDYPLWVMDHASHQLANYVLPKRFFPGLKSLVGLDAEGGKIATDVWQKFSSRKADAYKIRAVRARLNNEIRWVVRACVSNTYATYSHLNLVDDILAHAGEYAQLPVLEWAITDVGLRIRFSGLDTVTGAFASIDKSILDDALVPMIQMWNSEVGVRSVGLHGGLWRLASESGIGHWEKQEGFHWSHRGDSNRIRSQILEAFERTRVISQDIASAYAEAKNIQIEDIDAWVRTACAGLMGLSEIEEVLKNLADPRVTPGGSLASVVDAISLMSKRRAPMTGPIPENHPEPDIYQQDELEYAAACVMHKGRLLADKNNGVIPA